MTIWANTLVKNEERYLWFAISSVINHIDRMLIWDTGSTDNTLEIIESIKKKWPKKILFRKIGSIDVNEFTEARQAMLDETKADWVFILDGDEVWWDEKIKETINTINTRKSLQTVVNEYRNLVGDIYHFQDPGNSFYKIDGKIGPLTIRAMSIKNIKGLKAGRPHGKQGYFSGDKLVQELDPERRVWVNGVSYLHFTHLQRSGSYNLDREVIKRKKKYRYEVGTTFPYDYYYPEAFFRDTPSIVNNVWRRRSIRYEIQAHLLDPLRKAKRILISHKSGY